MMWRRAGAGPELDGWYDVITVPSVIRNVAPDTQIGAHQRFKLLRVKALCFEDGVGGCGSLMVFSATGLEVGIFDAVAGHEQESCGHGQYERGESVAFGEWHCVVSGSGVNGWRSSAGFGG